LKLFWENIRGKFKLKLQLLSSTVKDEIIIDVINKFNFKLIEHASKKLLGDPVRKTFGGGARASYMYLYSQLLEILPHFAQLKD